MWSPSSVRRLLHCPKLVNLSPKPCKNKCAPVYKLKPAIYEDREALLKFMRQHFYKEEPMRIGASPITTDSNDEIFHLQNITRNSVVLALKPDDTIIGAIIGSCKVPHQLEKISQHYGGKWGNILDMWARVDKESDIFKRFKTQRALHAYLLAVHRDYRGYGLASRMICKLAEIGRQQNYDILSMDATSVFAACTCQKLGMRLVNTLAYSLHMDQKGYVIFAPPPPHDAIRTYVLKL